MGRSRRFATGAAVVLLVLASGGGAAAPVIATDVAQADVPVQLNEASLLTVPGGTKPCTTSHQLFNESTTSSPLQLLSGARSHLYYQNRALDTTCDSQAVSTVHLASPVVNGQVHYFEFGYVVQRNATTGAKNTQFFVGGDAADGFRYIYTTTATGRLVVGVDDRYEIVMTTTNGVSTFTPNILFHDGTTVTFTGLAQSSSTFHPSYAESETEAFGPGTGFMQQFTHLQQMTTGSSEMDWQGVRCSTVGYAQIGSPRWNPVSNSAYTSTLSGSSAC